MLEFKKKEKGYLESGWKQIEDGSKEKNVGGPHCCGSVGGRHPAKRKDCWFDSQSGPTPGFRARSLAGGVQEATD